MVNNRIIIWLWEKFFLRDTAGSPERARWIHLARSGSQSQHAIWVIFLATRRAARNSQTWFAAHARVDLTRESGASRAYAYSRPSLPARVNAIRAGRRRTALFAGYPHTNKPVRASCLEPGAHKYCVISLANSRLLFNLLLISLILRRSRGPFLEAPGNYRAR